MDDPSRAFRAGFVCGLRFAWHLAPWPHLELMRGEGERDYEAGYAAGWLATDVTRDSKELLPLCMAAWKAYARV